MKTVAATILSAAALAGCAAPSAYEMTQEDRSELAEVLGDRVPGDPVTCLPAGTQRQRVIDDRTIVYERGRTVYLQSFEATCNGLDDIGNVLVINSPLGRTCAGDIARVTDSASGITGGSCFFKPFVPYTERD